MGLSLPVLQDIQKNVSSLIYLGVYLPPSHPSPLENWNRVKVRVSDQLWPGMGILHILSLCRRALVLNQLILFMLWHWRSTLSVPPGILTNLQRWVLRILWPGCYRVSSGVLCFPLWEHILTEPCCSTSASFRTSY